MISKAMILAAGFGKRLNPLTLECPKPLLKIGNETFLSNTINFLEKLAIKKVVINTHYLANQITEYLNKKNFKLDIEIINEKEKILDTGGGILNALRFFKESFLCINPDTIWNVNYVKEVKEMEKDFFLKKKCHLLVVNKLKSFDKSINGDFNLRENFLSRQEDDNLKYVYTGLQIINPEVFANINEKIFSINKVWDDLIMKRELFGQESKINFLHAGTLQVYKKLNFK